MKMRILLLTLLFGTIGVALWSAALIAPGYAEGSGTSSKTASAGKTTGGSTGTTSTASANGKSDSGSTDQKLDNGPQVEPRESIKPTEAIQSREPIKPRP